MQMRRRVRPLQRGVTLIEVLVVVAIMALVDTGIAVAAFKFFQDAKVKDAGTNARALRGAVKTYWMVHESTACPSFEEMVSAGVLDEASSRTDPWGKPWHIECTDTAVTVLSDGPDRTPGTADDIRAPPKTT
jgi:general secretion pathway protein G